MQAQMAVARELHQTQHEDRVLRHAIPVREQKLAVGKHEARLHQRLIGARGDCRRALRHAHKFRFQNM
jgi:hypothetical protein